MSKKMSKKWKSIVLVLLTIIVVGGVFLTIFLVEKNDQRNNIERHIDDINTSSKVDFCVKSVDITKSIGGVEADENNVWMTVTIDIAAKKNFTLKMSHFNVDKTQPSKAPNCLSESQKLNTGEQKTIKIAFQVPESGKTHRLYCFGYKVVLGSSLISQPIA